MRANIIKLVLYSSCCILMLNLDNLLCEYRYTILFIIFIVRDLMTLYARRNLDIR